MNVSKSSCLLIVVLLCLTISECKKRDKLPRKLINRINEEREKAALISELREGCSDEVNWCATYKAYCWHESVKTFCKKSCKICVPTTIAPTECIDTHPQCDIAYKRNYCTSSDPAKKNFVKRYCRKTCKLCGSKAEETCKDKRENCDRLFRFCTDATYSKYMKDQCSKTCGFCGKGNTCGVAKLRENADIVGGKNAQKGFYPWQAAIYYDDKFLCGGSLIDKKHVLTAAHCFKYLSTDTTRYRVVLGDHVRSLKEHTERYMDVKEIKQHEGYQYEADTHDIAIMKLNSEVILSDYITPICLPEAHAHLPVGSKCYLSGWGKTQHDGKAVDRLQHAEMPIASRRVCKERNTFNSHTVDKHMICAGYDDGSTFTSGCHGDSGGPLACERPDKSWVLYGVVSWGSPQCNGLNRYTVFSRVSMYINWISKNNE